MKTNEALGAALLTYTLLGGAVTAQAAQDCALGDRYLALAQERMAQFKQDEAIGYFDQAAQVCPTYSVYEQLGEIAAQSPDDADKKKAVDAFVSAHAIAATDRDRARTLYQYASLLNREGDPSNAFLLIKDAQSLDPGNQEIIALAQTIEQQVANPTKDQIVRALTRSLFEPLHESAPGRSPAKAAGDSPTRAGLGGSGAVPVIGPSVSIPINFETSSTRADERTRQNIATLARALADPSMAGQNFIFVGHADERGPEDQNLTLSKRRAQAMYEGVVSIEPSLQGRVDVDGRGEYEPIVPRHDEDAYRTNRRLQVLIK